MKYSIILPVRNGGVYVKDCVNSILTQKLGDFNLLVLDNCSTDGTSEWLASLQDERIRIYPSNESLSIDQNWGRIVGVPKNEFITMIGHDDLLDSDYLQIMDGLIQKHPGASLYETHFRYINSEGGEIRKCRPMIEMQKPADVVQNFLCASMDIMGTGLMMRSRDYDAIGGIPSYPNLLFADMELWIELSRKSYFATDSRECFSYRVHPGATTSTSTDIKVLNALDQFISYLEKLKNKDPELSNVISRDCDQLLKEYCQGITHKSLRIPYKKRQTPPVSSIIDQFREYGKRLKGDNSFEPLDSAKIRIGKFIDSNSFTRSLFLLFKKVFKKPVM
jgi:glycosyltransferase involved in cell wall biosynthesis